MSGTRPVGLAAALLLALAGLPACGAVKPYLSEARETARRAVTLKEVNFAFSVPTGLRPQLRRDGPGPRWEEALWILDPPADFPAEPPQADHRAVAEAEGLLAPVWAVRDAVRAPEGLVVLAEARTGWSVVALVLLRPEACPAAQVPAGAERLIFAGTEPLRALVLLPEDRALPAELELPMPPDGGGEGLLGLGLF